MITHHTGIVTYVKNIQHIITRTTERTLLFLDHIPEQIQGSRTSLTQHCMVPGIILNHRADIHPLTASFDLSLRLQLLQELQILLAMAALLSGSSGLLLLTGVVERALQRLDVIFKCSQNIGLAQGLELSIALKLVARLDGRLSLRPARVRLQIQ